MTSNLKTKTIILTTLGIIFTLLISMQNHSMSITRIQEENMDSSDNVSLDDTNLKISKVSGRIHIKNNWSAAIAAGIVTGSGTYSNPYTIEDLVIDGASSGFCIRIENSNYFLRIENCTVYNSDSISEDFWHWRPGIENFWLGGGGIILSNVNNSLVINNNASNNYRGILLEKSNNNTLSGNIVNNNDGYGIDLIDSYNNTLSGNIMNDHGFFITGSGDDEITEQQWDSLKIDSTNLVNGKPVYYYSNEKNLRPNNFSNAGQVFLANCSGSIISNLNISYNSMAIVLAFSNNSTISGNSLNNNFAGIILYESDRNNVSGNIAKYNAMGIVLEKSNNNSISGNTADNNLGQGISMNMSNNNSISGNNLCSNGGTGLILLESDVNSITGNNISNNKYMGIHIYNSNNNVISGNTVNNNENGIIIIDSCYTNVSDNILSNNTITDYYDNNGCIGIGLIPEAFFTVNATKISLSNNVVQFQFRGSKGDEPTTFQWNFGDGSASSSEINPTHQYNFSGIYTVILTVTDVDGDLDMMIRIDYITVGQEPTILGYNIFVLLGILSITAIIMSKKINKL
ncbi:MAG: NosD domain-containing protein [Promethearchaeota archaeon]|jgi:parallel beta-helix repeat protein